MKRLLIKLKIPIKISLACCTLLVSVSAVCGGPESQSSLATADLAELDRKLNNPLTKIWSLTFQNNTSVNTGDAVDGNKYANTLFFQPFMPFEVGANKQAMFTLRPVFPLVTQPVFESSSLDTFPLSFFSFPCRNYMIFYCKSVG
jgi:hypothetical protein